MGIQGPPLAKTYEVHVKGFQRILFVHRIGNKTINFIMKVALTVKPSAVAFVLCISPTQITS